MNFVCFNSETREVTELLNDTTEMIVSKSTFRNHTVIEYTIRYKIFASNVAIYLPLKLIDITHTCFMAEDACQIGHYSLK